MDEPLLQQRWIGCRLNNYFAKYKWPNIRKTTSKSEFYESKYSNHNIMQDAKNLNDDIYQKIIESQCRVTRKYKW